MSVQHPLKRRHVTLDDIFHLTERRDRSNLSKAERSLDFQGRSRTGRFCFSFLRRSSRQAFVCVQVFRSAERGEPCLLWKLCLHFLLQSAQQEGAEHFVEATDDQDGLLFIQVHLKTEEKLWQRDRSQPALADWRSSDGRVPHTFSPVMAKGALNHCSKVLQLLKMVGRRKLSSAQSSGSLFCKGVPVRRTRRGAR